MCQVRKSLFLSILCHSTEKPDLERPLFKSIIAKLLRSKHANFSIIHTTQKISISTAKEHHHLPLCRINYNILVGHISKLRSVHVYFIVWPDLKSSFNNKSVNWNVYYKFTATKNRGEWFMLFYAVFRWFFWNIGWLLIDFLFENRFFGGRCGKFLLILVLDAILTETLDCLPLEASDFWFMVIFRTKWD